MMRLAIGSKWLVFFAYTNTASSVEIDTRYASDTAAFLLEGDVVEAIQTIQAQTPQTLVPISGEVIVKSNVLTADQIVFQPGAKLVFSDVDSPFIVIAAKILKFARAAEPSAKYILTRSEHIPSDPGPVQQGANGRNGITTQGRWHGTPGKNGARGRNGLPGKTQQLPIIYFLAGTVELEGANDASPIQVEFQFSGIPGGRGGDGSRGGDGGRGGEGADADWQTREGYNARCRHEAGNGGNGGSAGYGGAGGVGGRGGNGASIVIAGPASVVEKMSYATFGLSGGPGGEGGQRGQPGRPGSGGNGGSRDRGCLSKASDGDSGMVPTNPHPPRGRPGAPGQQGSVVLYQVDDLSRLLTYRRVPSHE